MARKLQPYEFRHLNKDEKEEILKDRQAQGYPWHSPPHFSDGEKWYLITAANFEHQHIMQAVERRTDLANRILEGVQKIGGEVSAWTVLTNHYHLLAKLPELNLYGEMIGRLHRGTATEWNRQDGTSGRRVWYRFSDREVRNEQAFFAYFNYIHGNPVKHGLVQKADEWVCTSLHGYLEKMGDKYLRMLWRKYPTRDIGKGWDDSQNDGGLH